MEKNVKEKVKVHFYQGPAWTGSKDRHGKVYGDDFHEFYVVEWKNTVKRVPVTAKKIDSIEFRELKMKKEEINLRGKIVNTLNKVRAVSKLQKN